MWSRSGRSADRGPALIISRRPEGLVVVLQTDHQEQCAAMARAWGNEKFTRLEHWEDIEAAAGLHDEGWRRWEEAHHPAGDGPLVDFVDVPRETHVEIYRDGIAAAKAHSERAALLVSMHGSGLYERRFGLGGAAPPRSEQPQAVRDFLDEQERWRESVLGNLGPEVRVWGWAAYRLLQAWDALSLYLIWRALPSGQSGQLVAVPRRGGDAEGVTMALEPSNLRSCTLDPWPFSGDGADLVVRELTMDASSSHASSQAYRVTPAVPH